MPSKKEFFRADQTYQEILDRLEFIWRTLEQADTRGAAIKLSLKHSLDELEKNTVVQRILQQKNKEWETAKAKGATHVPQTRFIERISSDRIDLDGKIKPQS